MSYCVIFSSLVASLTKCINSHSPPWIILQLSILQLSSVEKMKLYVYKVNAFTEGKYFPSLLYSIWEGLNSFLSSETQKKYV